MVFVVVTGEQGEGGRILGVYGTHEAATTAALAHPPCFPGGWVKSGDDRWNNGCDFVLIERHGVISAIDRPSPCPHPDVADAGPDGGHCVRCGSWVGAA